jgi:hypothetical protein
VITAAARRFLMDRLAPIVRAAGWTATSTAGVVTPRLFHGVAPAGTTFPFVVFQMLSPGDDRQTQDGSDIWSDPLYLVKAVAQGTGTDAIETTVEAIDTALHNRRGSADGARVIECWRERRHEQPEVIDGRFYINCGGEYRLKIQEA